MLDANRNHDTPAFVLDANRNQVGSTLQGLGSFSWNQDLAAGSYTVEVRGRDRAPASVVQAVILAASMENVSSGGSLQRSTGASGYLGFAVAARSEVTWNLGNQQTFPNGAGEVILTVYEPSGRLFDQSGPGIPFARDAARGRVER